MKEEQFLKELLKEKDCIVFACSGGPDSMCLLTLLWKEQEAKKLKLICAHVNHKKRVESDKEYQFIKKYCEEKNIIFEGIEFQHHKKKNFHDEAHRFRKQFFEKIIKKYHANYFMTAHHGDDLMETILMRLTRGSSIKGYAGFQKIEKRDSYTLVRPFITATKEEIETFDKTNHIPYVIDKTNLSDHYTRNRFRHHVLPFLKNENKNVHLKFLEFHDKLNSINEFLVKMIHNALTDCLHNDTLHIVEWKKLEPFLQQEVLKEYFYQIYGEHITYLRDSHIKQTMDLLLNHPSNVKISLPKEYIGIKNYQTFKIKKKNTPKKYLIELNDFCKLETGVIKKISNSQEKSNDVIRLSSSEITLPLYLRTRKEKDTIASKNLNGHQKIKDIFIDKKIPKEERGIWPILVDAKDEILWIPGLKKSKFDKENNEKYDIIYKYVLSKEKDYVTKK